MDFVMFKKVSSYKQYTDKNAKKFSKTEETQASAFECDFEFDLNEPVKLEDVLGTTERNSNKSSSGRKL